MSPWAWPSVDKGRRAQETGVGWTGGNEDTLATTGHNGHLASKSVTKRQRELRIARA